MQKDIVSNSEGNVEWLEVSYSKYKHELSRKGKMQKSVAYSLSYNRQFASFANKSIENLSKNNGNKIGSLSIFASFSCIANW